MIQHRKARRFRVLRALGGAAGSCASSAHFAPYAMGASDVPRDDWEPSLEGSVVRRVRESALALAVEALEAT